jgi:hypothetical protein
VRGGWIVLVGWGALLVAFALVQLTFEPKAIELVLLGGSGLVVVVGGLVALLADRRGWGRRTTLGGTSRDVVRWTSGASVAVAVGVCLLVLGWELGAWMIGIGAGVTALGLAGVVRETRGTRE